jgi:hypothetical protein
MAEKPDGKVGRVIAALVLVAGIAAFTYLNRESFIAPPEVEEEIAQPALAACLDRRLGAVENMRAEDLLSDAQYELFKGRAEAYCLYEFGDVDSSPPPQ